MENQIFTFERWLKELSSIAFLNGYTYNLVESSGEDCWRDYFDDDYSPAEALIEDHSHADQLQTMARLVN